MPLDHAVGFDMGSGCLLKLAEVVLRGGSLRNKQHGKHPGSREAVKHHPGTYKGSYKHVPHSYFTSLLESVS